MEFKWNGDINILYCCSLEVEELRKNYLRKKRGQDPGQCVLQRKWSTIKSNQTLSHQLTTAAHWNHSLRLHRLHFHFVFCLTGKMTASHVWASAPSCANHTQKYDIAERNSDTWASPICSDTSCLKKQHVQNNREHSGIVSQQLLRLTLSFMWCKHTT